LPWRRLWARSLSTALPAAERPIFADAVPACPLELMRTGWPVPVIVLPLIPAMKVRFCARLVPIRIVLDSRVFLPALPMSMLFEPVVRFWPAPEPKAMFEPPLEFRSALQPIATLLEPVSFTSRASLPVATL
jgi:hypothetical protein